MTLYHTIYPAQDGMLTSIKDRYFFIPQLFRYVDVRSKQFLVRGERLASGLKELRGKFEANISLSLLTHVGTFITNLGQNEESVDQNSISLKIDNKTCIFL